MWEGVSGPAMEGCPVQGGFHLHPELPGQAPASHTLGLSYDKKSKTGIKGLENHYLICFYQIFLKCICRSHLFQMFSIRSVCDLYLKVWFCF